MRGNISTMDIAKKKKFFYIFMVINALMWTLVQMSRNVISIDSMEAIAWGDVLSAGTNKHPPMSGWLMGGGLRLFGQHDFAAYILGTLCISIGFFFVYKLAKFFMEEEKAICASLILSSCYYYTYILFIDNFNCNFLSMALWPMIAYYFYKSVKENKVTDWVIFGVVSALGVLCKYQVIFLFLALFLYLIICKREQFTKKGIYISILVGTLLVLPHIIWLFQTDFFSFIYMTGRTEIGAHNTPQFLIKYGRIVFPLKFILDQVCSVLSCIAVYLFIALQAKNISINKNWKTSESLFILSIALVPILAQSSMAMIENNRIMGIWGSIMVGFVGILLFHFFPIKFNKDTFKHFMKWMYSLLVAWLIAMSIFMLFQTKRTISYPHEQIMKDINAVWAKETNNADFKYVGGHIDYVFQFRLYNPRHPHVILETFGAKNPWENQEDIIKSGVLIVGKSKKNTIRLAKEMITLLPENYKFNVHRYNFEITNIVGKSKKYKFYYTIIPPKQKNGLPNQNPIR